MMDCDELRCGDALELLPEIEDGTVDILVTDPPYNISSEFVLTRQDDAEAKYAGGNRSHDFGEWDHDQITVEDWLPLIEPALSETAVVVIMYDYFRLTDVVETMESLGWEPRQPIVWHKANPVPQGHAVKWQEAAEIGIIGTVNEGQGHNYQADEGQRHNVVESPLCQGDERTAHPTQKPVELVKPVLRWWTEPGDLVLDPFMGVGTVPAVAKEFGRSYIGIEQDQSYYETAVERVEGTRPAESVPGDESETYEVQSVLDWG